SAKRRLDSFRKHGSTRFCGCRRIAKNSSESFAKTAGRFVTAAVFRFIHSTAPAHFAQRETQSARAMVSLECHSIVSLELPSRCGWIDCHRRKFFVRQPTVRGTFDFRAQALNQFGRTFVWIHRMAAQTGTITAVQCFTRRCEKIDILARRFFRCARWPAKKIPSKLGSRLTNARYIASKEGSKSSVFMGAQFASCNIRG